MASKKKATKTTQAEVMSCTTLTNETIEVKATQVEDFFNHLSEEIDLAAESGNIEALENLNYYAHLLWLKADQAENKAKAKASKLKQLEPEPQPELQPQPEPVKPARTKYVCWNYKEEGDTTYLYLANSHEEAKEVYEATKEDLSQWGYGLYEKAPKIGKLVTVKAPQPKSKPEAVKPAPVDQSINQTKKQMAQKRLDEILRAFPEYRMFLPRPLRLEGALKFIEDYGHLVPEVEPIKLHPNHAKAGKAGKVKKADDAPEYIGKVEPSKSGVAYAYRDLQKILKEARIAGKEVNCRLNGKRETLQAEAVRLGLL